MLTIPLSEFRQHSRQYIDAVEEGESIILIRHSRPVAQVIPVKNQPERIPSWKKPGIHLNKSFSLSDQILKEREE